MEYCQMKTKKDITRRDFVKILGMSGVVAALPLSLTPLADASSPTRFTETRMKMGTIVTLTAVGGSEGHCRDAFQAAWTEMDRLIAIFDRHQAQTAISDLNTAGRLSAPPPELLEVLEKTSAVYHLSSGAFDPTILPLLLLLETRFNQTHRPPAKAELYDVVEMVDFKSIRFDRSVVRFGKSGQQISLDGVAKGYIVDRAGVKLREMGITNALINAGGDILAIGCRENGRPWRVAIQDPFESGKYLKVISISDQAVATSGSYEIFFDPEKHYHHLMSPFTGESSNRLVSATTIAPNTAQADALSTAAFIQPSILNNKANIDGLIVSANGRQSATQGFKKMVSPI
jgi:FAD:protein FMN transferase